MIFEDLGVINYKSAWDYQELLVKKNLDIKAEARKAVRFEALVRERAVSYEPSATSNGRHRTLRRLFAFNPAARGIRGARYRTIFSFVSIRPCTRLGKAGTWKMFS